MADSQSYSKVHDFLKHHPMGVLSTADADGHPWGSAIYYVADDEFNFYFVTRVETLKYRNIEKNPHVALTIADPESQATVQVRGIVSKLPPDRYMEIVFDKLAKIGPKDDPTWAPPMSKLHKGNYMPLHLMPTKLQYADYKRVSSDPHAEYIEEIPLTP